ncbi:diaminohydroxyphosphoribosylaminopyrimidine deaminase [Fibrobacter sp. UWT2]|uniref:bifunctional diaminohydroxyphosphoribosylaminopyrimidine deaminase/5-amino-6-(5-phosphoribosylamino)uracil reductase n=1 Tax=Fibrobacter sp. UWT2 TaxID=1896224 RepID=UPI00090ECE71|nr:dihydrofolate reductase family protein [Fibrobacter sp. UWT2]SHK98201.1 diaminohydroxyphosphoribosylaminopyrimidine deaminase [Fibrobacter sp. UWT2]
MNYLQLAFENSLFSVGISRPNPAVGAVVVRDGIVVGKGRTQRPGNAHAEVMALRDAGELARGAAIYVTLEPCCHYGRTPPCTKAIIEAGIKEVYFAHADPNPLVRGKSRSILEEAGIKVFEGQDACERAIVESGWDDSCSHDGCKVLSGNSAAMGEPETRAEALAEARMLFHEIERFFEAYDFYVRNKTTFVEIKSAISQEGFMGACQPDGSHAPLKITGQGANCWNHELRAMSDAILVGAGTVLADNPSLDVRLAQGNNPVKIIWAGHHEFTAAEVENLRVFQAPVEKGKAPIVFTCVPQPALEKKNVGEAPAVEVVALSNASFVANWHEMHANLSARGMHRLMVEPGARLADEIFKCGLWNRLDLWQSSDPAVDRALESSGADGLTYPELPTALVARESFMLGPDVLTVYSR